MPESRLALTEEDQGVESDSGPVLGIESYDVASIPASEDAMGRPSSTNVDQGVTLGLHLYQDVGGILVSHIILHLQLGKRRQRVVNAVLALCGRFPWTLIALLTLWAI